MEIEKSFNIVPLLKYEINKDGDLVIRGPFSPVHAANDMAKLAEIKYHHLARILFNNDYTLQSKDGDGRTYYDHLVLVSEYGNYTGFFMVIDMGIELCPTAMWIAGESVEDMVIAPAYDKVNFIKRLDKSEFKDIFDYMLTNPETYLSANYEKFREKYGKKKV